MGAYFQLIPGLGAAVNDTLSNRATAAGVAAQAEAQQADAPTEVGPDTAGSIDVSGAADAALLFGLGDGSQTVSGFSTSGSSLDVLVFSKDIFADWAHLLGATKQQGSDLLLTLDASDSVLLKNVSLANFTSVDARFV